MKIEISEEEARKLYSEIRRLIHEHSPLGRNYPVIYSLYLRMSASPELKRKTIRRPKKSLWERILGA